MFLCGNVLCIKVYIYSWNKNSEQQYLFHLLSESEVTSKNKTWQQYEIKL